MELLSSVSPLAWAAHNGHEVVRFLLRQEEVNPENKTITALAWELGAGTRGWLNHYSKRQRSIPTGWVRPPTTVRAWHRSRTEIQCVSFVGFTNENYNPRPLCKPTKVIRCTSVSRCGWAWAS